MLPMSLSTLMIVVLLIAISAASCCAGGAGQAWTFQNFDKLDSQLNRGDGYKTGTGGLLAWGESYLMLAYVEMYKATHLERYLDKLVDHADHVLATRDDNRKFKDYAGRSRPAWSVGDQYTVAELILKDSAGKPCLKFRSTMYAYNDQTKLTVKPGAQGSLDLMVQNEYWKGNEEYRNLSMDPELPDFVERRVNAKKWVAKERKVQFGDKGSALVTVEVVGGSRSTPAAVEAVPMQPLWMAYHGYSGQITFPMLEFASIVKKNPALKRKYGVKADHYIAEVAKVFRDADEEWRDGPGKDEGYYVFGSRGCPFWSDNVAKPFNYLGSEGLCLVRLAQLTGDHHWESKAKAIARLLKNNLRAEDGAYVWEYWWGPIVTGWTRDNSPSYNTPTYSGSRCIEDTSHGALEVYFMTLCADAGWVFDATDMKLLAGTFVKRIADAKNWTLNDTVDGKGEWGAHDAMVGYWMELAKWDPQVAGVGITVCEKQKIGSTASPSAMLSLARAIRWSAP